MEIPPRLSRRPLYANMPVPYVQCVGDDGIPDFKVVDIPKVIECAKKRLCTLCGEKLDATICFIGGEKSLHSRTFADGPMHEECALYAAKTCPFCSRSDRGYAKNVTRLKDQGLIVLENKLIDRNNVARMLGILYCTDFAFGRLHGTQHNVFLAQGILKLDAHTMPESD